MKLNELLNDFETKNKEVLLKMTEIQAVPQFKVEGFIRKGYCIVYKNANGGIEVKNVFVVVKNLGKEDEEAYWENNEPIISYKSSEPVETFRNKVEKFIKNAKEKEIIYTAIIENLDESLKSAFVKAIKKDDAGNYVEKKLAIRYNSETEKIEYVEIT